MIQIIFVFIIATALTAGLFYLIQNVDLQTKLLALKSVAFLTLCGLIAASFLTFIVYLF